MGVTVDRKGRRVSELDGPASGAPQQPPPLRQSDNPHRAWNWHGWAWDHRALCWRAEWRHVSYPVTVRDYGEYVAGTLNYRHWHTASTPTVLLDALFPTGEFDKAHATLKAELARPFWRA